jgi:hypothetical protein
MSEHRSGLPSSFQYRQKPAMLPWNTFSVLPSSFQYRHKPAMLPWNTFSGLPSTPLLFRQFHHAPSAIKQNPLHAQHLPWLPSMRSRSDLTQTAQY